MALCIIIDEEAVLQMEVSTAGIHHEALARRLIEIVAVTQVEVGLFIIVFIDDLG